MEFRSRKFHVGFVPWLLAPVEHQQKLDCVCLRNGSRANPMTKRRKSKIGKEDENKFKKKMTTTQRWRCRKKQRESRSKIVQENFCRRRFPSSSQSPIVHLSAGKVFYLFVSKWIDCAIGHVCEAAGRCEQPSNIGHWKLANGTNGWMRWYFWWGAQSHPPRAMLIGLCQTAPSRRRINDWMAVRFGSHRFSLHRIETVKIYPSGWQSINFPLNCVTVSRPTTSVATIRQCQTTISRRKPFINFHFRMSNSSGTIRDGREEISRGRNFNRNEFFPGTNTPFAPPNDRAEAT